MPKNDAVMPKKLEEGWRKMVFSYFFKSHLLDHLLDL